MIDSFTSLGRCHPRRPSQTSSLILHNCLQFLLVGLCALPLTGAVSLHPLPNAL